MQEMLIYGVSFDLVGKQPIVLLKTAEGNKFLPIWIGINEANAIALKITGMTPERPITHDLLANILGAVDINVDRIVVTSLANEVFYARILAHADGRQMEIDSRPSDALALAVRTSAPIFAADDVIEESAIEFEGEEVEDTEQVVDKFKEFLDNVTPEDFAQGEGEEP